MPWPADQNKTFKANGYSVGVGYLLKSNNEVGVITLKTGEKIIIQHF